MKQEMTGWQWHQLDHMQIIRTFLQTDNVPAPHHSIFTGRSSSCRPTNSITALQPVIVSVKKYNYLFWQASSLVQLVVVLALRSYCYSGVTR